MHGGNGGAGEESVVRSCATGNGGQGHAHGDREMEAVLRAEVLTCFSR